MSRNVALLASLVLCGGLVFALVTKGKPAEGGPAQAAEKKAAGEKKAPKREADESAIRKAAQEMASAFEKGDAKAIADFWTEEGEYIDEAGGEPVRGRTALTKSYADFFAKRPQLKVELKTTAVRFLGKDTAVEEGTFTARAKGRPAETSQYSALYVRQGGRWLIALLKEWDNEAAESVSLRDLSWLIGSWEGAGADSVVQVNYRWDANRAFILSRYSIRQKKDNKVIGSGTQVIGYDAGEGVIRAWTFDSEGGFGEAVWNWDGDRWSIDSHGTLADGSSTTAVNLLTPAGEDAFTWRSVKRTQDDESLPDLAPVKVKRVKEEK